MRRAPAGRPLLLPLWLLAVVAFLAGSRADAETSAPASGNDLIVVCDDVVRLGMVYRFQVARPVAAADFDRGPFVLQLTLTQAGQVIAMGEYQIAKLGQLRDGVRLNVVPSRTPPSDEPVTLNLTVTNPQRTDIQRFARQLATPLGLEHAIGSDFARLVAADPLVHEPLPYLWAEQASETTSTGVSLKSCAMLSLYERELAGWLMGQHPAIFPVGCSERAFRDPCDGSVQPYRLHLPKRGGQMPSLAVVFPGAGAGLRKSEWPMLPPAFLAAAREAGVALLEIYPGGDRTWCGVGVERARLALRACIHECPELAEAHRVAIGIASGANGAIALAEQDPEHLAALLLIDPSLAVTDQPDDVQGNDQEIAQWLAVSAPGGRPVHLTGMPILVSGETDHSCTRWLERLSRCGEDVLRQVPDPSSDRFWNVIAGYTVSQPPREYLVPTPGRYGPVLVTALSTWGTVGSLRIESRSPLRISTHGIASVIPDGPAEVDGRPWRAAPSAPVPAKIFGQACGPLAAYAGRPFVVVVGTIENPASTLDNRQLAKAFLSAWYAHAQGHPPLIDDHDFHAQDFPASNLVLIGNRRSNAVLRQLLIDDKGFPLSWDSRSVFCQNGTFLRDQHRAVALAWPHPAHDGRLLVVLDGALPLGKAPSAGCMPLAGLPDLVVAGETPGSPPLLEKLFDGEWK